MNQSSALSSSPVVQGVKFEAPDTHRYGKGPEQGIIAFKDLQVTINQNGTLAKGFHLSQTKAGMQAYNAIAYGKNRDSLGDSLYTKAAEAATEADNNARELVEVPEADVQQILAIQDQIDALNIALKQKIQVLFQRAVPIGSPNK